MLRPLLACGALAAAIPAFAQTPLFPSAAPSCAIKNSGTYGPVSFAPNPTKRNCEEKPGTNEPACIGRSSYPISDWKYIRQFCGPTLAPGSNYGYFETKWRKWDDRTPEVILPAPYQNIPAPTPASEALDKPKEEPKDKPKGDPMEKPKKELAETKIPEAVKLESLPAPKPYPTNVDLFLPVVPLPPAPMPILPLPKEPVKILPSEFSRPMVDTTPRVVAPQPEATRPVVPPQPNFK